ncbi:MAG: inverse autotransporter beta domain-containing protein, partial [Morganella sp. (in: enterobacteria)]
MSSQAAPLHYYSKNLRVTAFILLFLQFFFPISVSFSAVARAAEKAEVSVSPDDMINTMSGIQALMGTDSASLPPPPAKTESFPSPDSLLPGFPVAETGSGGQYPAVHDNAVRRDDILSALPALGLPDTPADSRETPETRAAQGVSQAGQLLSADDVTEASIGYVRSIGENLLNQQINDWLNQVGHARFQLGSNKTGDADLLVPLIDNPNSLLFSQIGLRANEERTTTNLGLGYRQYEDGWMWGVNSFYDYDITGSNSRVGVGGELWADYLKFAANGYFRVTDWHQSTLHEMRDYDERPANGFDIRAEGYLPDYPQLGAFAKYEQYFGDGISLAGTTSSGELKNNPSVSTVGLSYTPFPLLTFKGETSRGDSNDSKVGMELSYRFGMPLSQQLDTGNVDLMRNLAGNRYDFVDRNYNIVMQYRKQELLRISLPDSMTAEAAETVAVTATVDKSKYGLKSIAWSAPELTARGGSIQVTSPVTINLTLPAYVFSVRANEPQQYRLSAVGTDNEGNESNTAVMWVNVKPSQETITSLTLSPDRVIAANNTDTYSATALIRNEKGEALAHRDVTFSAGGFTDNSKVTLTGADSSTGETVTVTTDANGQAVITVRSKLAGQGVLKAEMKNGNFRDVVLRFDADKSTAQITALTLTRDKAVANGQTANTALATVADQFGNAVTDFTLNSSATNGAVIAAPVQTTNTDGQTTVSFTNVNAGESVLTVSGINTQKTASAQFIADISTARIAGVVVNDDNAVADGKARNKVTVTVVDGNNNVLADAPVTITVPGTATYITQPANGLTDNHGGLVIYYTNTKAGTVNYPVSINNSHDAASLTFKADSTNPDGEQSTLTVSPKTIKADGIDAADITLVLKDKFGNEISDQTVTFTTPLSGTSISSVSDNSDGSYFATLSGTKAGETPVLVSVNGQILQTGPASVILTAGEAAQNTSAIGVDNTTYVSGTDITVTVTLKDAQGNSVSGQASALTADTVTVPNASVKAGSSWTDNGDGTYTGLYTAKTVSTDNKAA